MEAIISLFSTTNSNEVILSSTGKRLASFLPGICIAMTDVAIGDTKQGSRVTSVSKFFNFKWSINLRQFRCKFVKSKLNNKFKCSRLR